MQNIVQTIKSRVIEVRLVKLGELLPDPANWKNHTAQQKAAFDDLISDVGFAGAVLTRKVMVDGVEMLMLVDGHMRRDKYPDLEVYTLITDLTESEAHELLLFYDPIAQLAESDAKTLRPLLESVDTESAALREIMEQLEKTIEPEIETGDAGSDDVPDVWGVIVACKNEAEQVKLLAQLLKEGHSCRALLS